MSGPSWIVRQFVKGVTKSLGADPITATVISRTAGGLTSLIFHDHHTHFFPDTDHVTDTLDVISDHDHISDCHDHISNYHDADYNHHAQVRSGSGPSNLSNLDQVSNNPNGYPQGYYISDHVTVTQYGSEHKVEIEDDRWDGVKHEWSYHVKSTDGYDQWVGQSEIIRKT